MLHLRDPALATLNRASCPSPRASPMASSDHTGRSCRGVTADTSTTACTPDGTDSAGSAVTGFRSAAPVSTVAAAFFDMNMQR